MNELIDNRNVNEIDWNNLDANFEKKQMILHEEDIEIRDLYKNIDWKALYLKDGLPAGVL